MPWAGNIAKTIMLNGNLNSSLLLAKCWPLLKSLQLTAVFLFCYITNHLMTGPLGIVSFVSLESQCFPRFRPGKHWDSIRFVLIKVLYANFYQIVSDRHRSQRTFEWYCAQYFKNRCCNLKKTTRRLSLKDTFRQKLLPSWCTKRWKLNL